jgi:hypothetical protein
MTINLSQVQQRMVAIALLAFSVTLVWFAVIDPIVGFAEDSLEKRQVSLRVLRRDRALLAQEPKTVAALEAIDHSPRWERLYASQKPEQAILEMETDLRQIITTPNNPTSMIAQGVVVTRPLSKIAVKVTMSVPIDQLADTLARMQSHAKYLRIENLLIQAPDYAPAESNPTLSIQADVTGYLLAPRGSTT